MTSTRMVVQLELPHDLSRNIRQGDTLRANQLNPTTLAPEVSEPQAILKVIGCDSNGQPVWLICLVMKITSGGEQWQVDSFGGPRALQEGDTIILDEPSDETSATGLDPHLKVLSWRMRVL